MKMAYSLTPSTRRRNDSSPPSLGGVGLPAGISSCTSAIALQASGDLSRSRRMLQFVLGWRAAGGLDPGSAGDALGAMAGRAGLLDPARLRRWRSPDGHVALAWLAHDPAQLGGVEYVHAEERRVALFAGRPVRWDAAGREADGAGPPDPRTYGGPSRGWRDAPGRPGEGCPPRAE